MKENISASSATFPCITPSMDPTRMAFPMCSTLMVENHHGHLHILSNLLLYFGLSSRKGGWSFLVLLENGRKALARHFSSKLYLFLSLGVVLVSKLLIKCWIICHLKTRRKLDQVNFRIELTGTSPVMMGTYCSSSSVVVLNKN